MSSLTKLWMDTLGYRPLLAETFTDIEKFREIPGYLVFYNLLRDIDPKAMAKVLTQWLGEHVGSMPGALAMDGKFIRDTVGVLTLADHETGTPEARAHCSKKKATAKTANS